MTVSTAVRAALAGGVVAATIGVAAQAGDARVPAASATLRAAIAEQQAALRALPRSGQASPAGYRRSLAHVNAALGRLRSVEAALVTAARETGPLPHAGGVQRMLDRALGGDSLAATELGEALWLMARGVPATNTTVAELRSDLRGALAASRALAKLIE